MPIDRSHPHVALVLRYFDACQIGSVEALKATLHPDVVHYFLPAEHPPVRGADHLARYWAKFHRLFAPTWQIDHTLAGGDEVVSEWSCRYKPTTGGESIFRGTEWYVVRDGLISEVRAYYRYREGEASELNGFPYRERAGYLPSP